jgi:hypothetical protein
MTWPIIFQIKQHFTRSEHTPRVDKVILMLIFLIDINLGIALKSIHEREDFISNTFINNFIDEWNGIIVSCTHFVQILKIGTDIDSPIYFIDRNRVRYLLNQGDMLYESNFQ